MQFKLIVAFVDDQKTDEIMKCARDAGATGATVITSARGEGLKQKTTFFGLELNTQRDVILFVVEAHMSKSILERIAHCGEFDDTPGTGIAVMLDVEDAVGVKHQVTELFKKIEDEL